MKKRYFTNVKTRLFRLTEFNSTETPNFFQAMRFKATLIYDENNLNVTPNVFIL